MKYYWCVDCGYHGIFDFDRLRGISCESCGYDDVTGFTEEEVGKSDFMEKHNANKTDSIYDGRLKLKQRKVKK